MTGNITFTMIKPSAFEAGYTGKILAMIESNPSITTDEMAEALGLARRSVTKQLTKLKNEGRIRRVGPDKGGHWEVIK